MILRVPEWESFDWFQHGFGTRQSAGWTNTAGRAWLKQIHSSHVVKAEMPGFLGEGDALVTDRPGLMLEIRTADCVPILLIDSFHRAVASIHAGWRGTHAQITAVTVEKMTQWFGSKPSDIFAAIGPAIGKCCFEVGPDVSGQFGYTGKVNLDLAEMNRQQLIDTGVPSDRITDFAQCTKCKENFFHSYRREREAAGRMETAIEILGTKN